MEQAEGSHDTIERNGGGISKRPLDEEKEERVLDRGDTKDPDRPDEGPLTRVDI